MPSATVILHNLRTNHEYRIVTGSTGGFRFPNLALDSYELRVTASGFRDSVQTIALHSSSAVHFNVAMGVAASSQQVTVSAQPALPENIPLQHHQLSSEALSHFAIQPQATGMSKTLVNTIAGVADDANGQLDPLGEEGDSTFLVDGQPITNQQSRLLSNQTSLDAVQSMEVLTGIPPAEYGDRTTLVVKVSTPSGLDIDKPIVTLSAGYSSFGTSTGRASLTAGGKRWGNFLSLSGFNTGRFLDTPEFYPIDAHGNAESFFDRLDLRRAENDRFQLNLGLARSWFQVPNTFDSLALGQNQREQLRSFNIAPGYTHTFAGDRVLSANAWVHQQQTQYYPSSNFLADQPATFSESNRLTDAGIRLDYSFIHGRHSAKMGAQFQHHFLSEKFALGLTDPLFNAVCVDADQNPVVAPGVTGPELCSAVNLGPNPAFVPGLLPFDLTRNGHLFDFRGGTDIKQEAFYLQDMINLGKLTLMLGTRIDNYNGLIGNTRVQPRTNLSYLIERTGTVLRAGYGRTFVSPINENLVIASSAGTEGLAQTVFGANQEPIRPGSRTEFDLGFEQSLGGRAVVTANYVWRSTRPAYDTDVLFNTPLVFPTQWRKSKIDGVTVRVTLPEYRGLSAYSVLGHLRARFFGPETGGILFDTDPTPAPFRIDQDQAFEQTTYVQYQFRPRWPWLAFTWRYDSGLVNDSVPDYATALGLTADQQAAIGLFCGTTFATLSDPIRSCPDPHRGALRAVIPADGTLDRDKNPPRLSPRHVFDLGLGCDSIFHGDRYKMGAKLTVVNLANKQALYNFLSEFSGTHFIFPRSYTAEISVTF